MKKNNQRKCILASLILLLTSCGKVSLSDVSPRGVKGNDPVDPTTQSFVLEDTIAYTDPYREMTIRQINEDVVESVRRDREEKNRQRQEDREAFQDSAILALSSAASIGSALYTKNYSSITTDSIQNLSGSVMQMLGYDQGSSVLSFSTKVLNALQHIQEQLQQISTQISEMEINLVDRINNLQQNLQLASNKILDSIADSEVRIRFSNSLTFFQTAKANWDHFVTSQYVPLQNMCNDFLATYTDYFGDFLDRCYLASGLFVTVYYTEGGTVTLPRRSTDYDFYGARIARHKTIQVPLAENTFAKMNALGGVAYNLIDLDILQDLLDQGMEKEDAKDVIKQLRLNAARSYFKDAEAIQGFFNAYINFGEALTGMTLEGVDASNMNPIAVYHALLSSVYNFGFETEEEIVALIAKMARVYYSASYINDMARMFSTTNVYEDRFNLIESQIVKELTTQNRANPNVGSKFFSYDVDSYVEFQSHELKLLSEFYAGKTEEYDDDEWCQDFDKPEYESSENGTHVYLDGHQIFLSDVEEASVSYPDFEMMKIKYVHNILPSLSEPISFGTYLMRNGLINDPGKSVVFSLDNLFDEDEGQDVAADPTYSLYLTGEHQNEDCDEDPGVRFSKVDRGDLNDISKVVVGGKVATFDTDIGVSGNYVLGVGYKYYDLDGDDYRLDAFSAHPEVFYEDDAMGDFINVHAIDDDDDPIDYKDGALGFVLTDITDCYILSKTTVG